MFSGNHIHSRQVLVKKGRGKTTGKFRKENSKRKPEFMKGKDL